MPLQATSVRLGRAGLPAATVRVAGIVDLPQSDSLFQKVGSAGQRATHRTAGQRPASPRRAVAHDLRPRSLPHAPIWSRPQIHVRRDHHLPSDPASAYTAITAAAHNLEARSSGGALVGDNLGAALGAARQDAAYAQVLFLFLGLPGAILAGLLTATIAAAGATRRRAEQALLRARGASARQLLRLAAIEAAAIGVAGSVLGLAIATCGRAPRVP